MINKGSSSHVDQFLGRAHPKHAVQIVWHVAIHQGYKLRVPLG